MRPYNAGEHNHAITTCVYIGYPSREVGRLVEGELMSPMERQGRILLAGAVLLLFVTVFISMLAADPFTLGFIFAAGVGAVGLFFFLRGR